MHTVTAPLWGVWGRLSEYDVVIRHIILNAILPDNGYFSSVIRGGVQFDYRLNQSLELNLLAELNVTDDKFNAFAAHPANPRPMSKN